MNVLGVSYGYHDASAALVVDGQVVAASAEERFSRQKHDANFPTYAIRACLEAGNLSLADIDQVVFHEDPYAKFSRVLCAAVAPFPASRREFVNSMKAWLGRKLWAFNTLSSKLNVPPERISYLGHHFSHAVTAFMGSGFEKSAILVVDAVGDWACTALYSGEWKDGRPEVKRILEIAYPNSLGLVYSAFTAWLGFSPNDSECSTMALASFGKPVYAEQVRQIISQAEDSAYAVDQSYFNFQTFYRGAVSDRFTQIFGPARRFQDKLPFASFGESGEVTPDIQRFADGAASVQLVLEEHVLALCERLQAAFPSENLCYAGGVAMNCVCNSRVLHESSFKNIYIPPDPGDGGTSVGTALYYAAVNEPKPLSQPSYGPYLGSAFDEAEDVAMIDHVKVDHVLAYLKKGARVDPEMRWKRHTYESDQELCAEIAKRLFAGEVVGWCQGRAELGPRALGNRSILIRPDDVALATRLSRTVKERAAFRPYALAMTAEEAGRILDSDRIASGRWMQFAYGVRPEVASQVACGLHVDGTTRAQVCTREDNPLFHGLLAEFGRLFGLPVVINTSFNASGYPIVTTPIEALAMFARTDMDVLVLNRTIVWKEYAVARQSPTLRQPNEQLELRSA